MIPRFKILTCGVAPGNLYSKTEYGIESVSYSDTTTCTRGTIQNNIQSLAYDDEFFYVNYSWDELAAAGLIDDDLVIAKATIPESIINTDLNIQGTVVIAGDITIANGASMELYANSSVLVSDGFGIYNHGDLIISGGTARSVLISDANQQWAGITSYRDGSLICDGAVIEGTATGLQIRGASVVNNSEIRNCYQGISIDTRTAFLLEGNTIRLNSYGIIVSNNYVTSELGYIQSNEISQNGIGMLLYNSNTKLALNDIHNNARAGLYLVRGSEPIIKECNISFTESSGLPRPEIMLESESYPIIDDSHNDVNADGIGYAMFYDHLGKIQKLAARNNYWGSTNPISIRQLIYPLDWLVEFEPYSMEPNTSFLYLNDTLFKQALAAEDRGELSLAKQLFTSVVATEPDSLYALQSLGRLNSIYCGTPGLLSELRAIYNTYTASCSDSILVKSSQIKSIMLDRFAGIYLDAVQGYEDQLQISTTDIDSLLCLLDIAYTLQEMYYDDQGKGVHTEAAYQANGLHVSSLKEARQAVDQLWERILNRPENTSLLELPVPGRLEITNYPNPFNPTTTIAFSLPKAGKVRVAVYNLKGQKVKDLINSELPRGNHKLVWDGTDAHGRSVGSGIYLVRAQTSGRCVNHKIMLLK